MAEAATLEQQRARSAIAQTSKIGNADEYYRQAASFGPMVVGNGLAGAWVFLSEKGKPGVDFLAHVEEWLRARFEDRNLPGKKLIERLASMECDAATYREITQEALAYATWLKRLAGAKKAAGKS